MCNPFLIPFVEGTVLLAKRVHGLCRRHLSFDRDEVCFKSGAEIIPTAEIRVCKGKRGLLSVSGPFPGRSTEFEVGESTRNAFAIGLEDILVEEVVGFKGRPK